MSVTVKPIASLPHLSVYGDSSSSIPDPPGLDISHDGGAQRSAWQGMSRKHLDQKEQTILRLAWLCLDLTCFILLCSEKTISKSFEIIVL